MHYVKLNDVYEALEKSKNFEADFSMSSMGSMGADEAEQQNDEFLRLLKKLPAIWVDDDEDKKKY